VDELLLVCQAKLPQLVCGALTVDRVEVKHPRLAVRRLGDGRWNVASLAPAGACDQPPPQVVVTHGELSISDTALRQAPPVVLRDIHLTVTPAASPPGEAPKFRIDGAMGGPHVRRLEVRATLAGTGSAGSASLSVEQFQMTSALLAWARPQLPAAINQIRVEAMLDGQAALQWFADGRPPRVDAELAVSEGRVDDALLPAPITELAGQIVVAGDQLQVRNMRGKCGAAEVGAAVNRSGWAPRAPLAAVLTATDAVLDDALYQSLRRFDAAGLAVAGELVEQWDRFDPAGVVDGTLQVTFDSQRWTPTALLTGRQLSFQSEKFPYRLTEGTGVIRYTPPTATAPDLVDVEMTARGGGQPLRIVGQVIDPQPGAAGWAQITGEALDIEQRMIAAIASEKCRDVISELHPSGRFNVNWRIERATPGAEPRTALRLDLTDVRINYDRFPYPLRGIRGTMTAQDDLWTFTDLVSGGRRPVRGSGTLRPVDGGVEMSLRISGEQTSLDVALYDALPEAARRAWTELNPRGEVDFARETAYRPGQARPSLHVAIRPRPES
ncbi:MAG TPA: DUF748 domain-containing protein, partial [Lacipirellulaceae bacterium]|nr:DUF748 domain-containing protein [Lacipirellulaceae bacterium]